MYSIFLARYNIYVLPIISHEIGWLLSHRNVKLEYSFYELFLVVKLKYTIIFAEYQSVWLFIWSPGFLEMELHAHFVEYRYLIHDNLFVHQELIIIVQRFSGLPFENEELVLRLFVHHKVLARDNC
jgi:hypothetical protein